MNISEFLFLYHSETFIAVETLIDKRVLNHRTNVCDNQLLSCCISIWYFFIHAIIPQSLIYNKPIKLTVIQHKGYKYDNQEIPKILLLTNGNIFIRVPDINRILNDISYKVIQGIGSGFL